MLDKRSEVKIIPRDAELTLGVIGGILGLIGSILYLQYNMVPGNEKIFGDFVRGAIRIVACIFAFKAAYHVQYEARLSGVIFIICGFTLVTLVNATIPGGIVLFIVGVMCFIRQ